MVGLERLASHAFSALALSLMVLGLAGCSGSPSSTDSQTPAATASSPKSTASAEVGQCRNIDPSKVMDFGGSWADDTPVVSCTSKHTVETVAVFDAAHPTRSGANADGQQCVEAMRSYIDSGVKVPAPDWPLQGRLFVPTPSEVHAGQRWVRCDWAMASDTKGTRAAVRTRSLKGALTHASPDNWLCLRQVPDTGRSQSYVSCARPHRAETSPSQVLLAGLAGMYPQPATLRRVGARHCASVVKNASGGKRLDGKPIWATADAWDGDSLRGGCWLWRTDGGLLSAMK